MKKELGKLLPEQPLHARQKQAVGLALLVIMTHFAHPPSKSYAKDHLPEQQVYSVDPSQTLPLPLYGEYIPGETLNEREVEIELTIPPTSPDGVPARILNQLGLIDSKKRESLIQATNTTEIETILGEEFVSFTYRKEPHYLNLSLNIPLNVGDFLSIESKKGATAIVTRVETDGTVFGYTDDGETVEEVVLYDPQVPAQGWIYKKGQEGAYDITLFRNRSKIEENDWQYDPHDPYHSIAPHYGADVLAWKYDMERWAIKYQLNPNLIAGLMRMESTGRVNPDTEEGDNHFGLFQLAGNFFKRSEDPYDPEINANKALDPKLKVLHRNMFYWNFSGALNAAHRMSEEERLQRIDDLREISQTSTFYGWALKSEAYRYDKDNVDFYLAYIFDALEDDPHLLDIFYAYFSYHAGTHMMFPYDARKDKIDTTQDMIDLREKYSQKPVLASSINYGIRGLYYYLLSQQNNTDMRIVLRQASAPSSPRGRQN